MKLLWIVFAVIVAIVYGGTEQVQIDTNSVVNEIDEHFLGSGWEMWSYLDNVDILPNPFFRKVISNIGPGIIRVGGITCDFVNYTVGTEGELQSFWPDYERPISMDQFKALVSFAEATNMQFVFGLNEIHGRNCHVNTTDKCEGNWDTSNVRAFLTYLRDNKVGPIYGFELGNELTAYDIHIHMSTNIEDYITLNKIIMDIWPNEQNRPPIFGPSVDHCDSDVDLFMSQTKSFLKGFTFHTYPGRDGTKLADEEVSINWLKENILINDLHANSSYCIQSWNKIGKPVGMELWITETNAAYNGILSVMGGHENSFFYLSSLGQYAKTGVQRHCRWSLIGGDGWGFVNRGSNGEWTVFPDYWIAVLHKKLIGSKVLNATGAFTESLVYAQCGKESGTVVLLVVNPSNTQVTLDLSGISSVTPRDEYIFTAESLASQTVQLNGDTLIINKDGTLPSTLKPRTVTSDNIVLPQYSSGYIVLTKAGAKACQ